MKFAPKIMAILLMLTSHAALAAAADIVGTWQTIDDATGKPKAIVNIVQKTDGSYAGTYIKPVATPKYTVCQNCPAPFTGKAIAGIELLWQLKAKSASSNDFVDGNILDPATGKIYACKATLSDDKNTLKVRGFVGISLLGRTQTWVRK